MVAHRDLITSTNRTLMCEKNNSSRIIWLYKGLLEHSVSLVIFLLYPIAMAKLSLCNLFSKFPRSSLIPSSCQHTGAFTHFNPRCDNWYNSPACLTDKCIYRAFLTKQFCVPSISKSRWLRYKDISKPIFFLNPRNLQVCWHSFKVLKLFSFPPQPP